MTTEPFVTRHTGKRFLFADGDGREWEIRDHTHDRVIPGDIGRKLAGDVTRVWTDTAFARKRARELGVEDLFVDRVVRHPVGHPAAKARAFLPVDGVPACRGVAREGGYAWRWDPDTIARQFVAAGHLTLAREQFGTPVDSWGHVHVIPPVTYSFLDKDVLFEDDARKWWLVRDFRYKEKSHGIGKRRLEPVEGLPGEFPQATHRAFKPYRHAAQRREFEFLDGARLRPLTDSMGEQFLSATPVGRVIDLALDSVKDTS